MPDGSHSKFGFINSLLTLFVSFGLTLLLLWAASRLAGATAFEQLPDWLRSGYSALFTALISGGSLGVLAVKAAKDKSGPNFLLAIIGMTLLMLVVIVILAKAFPSRVAPSPVVNPEPEPPHPEPAPPVVPEKTLHTEDEEGHPYVVSWQMAPNCQGFVPDDSHKCNFTKTQMTIGGDNTPFDHWDLSVKAPGAVYDVLCQTTGSNEFNEVKGDQTGTPEGDWGRCQGWINGGDAPISITARYKVLR
jgi:hypothetical protein